MLGDNHTAGARILSKKGDILLWTNIDADAFLRGVRYSKMVRFGFRIHSSLVSNWMSTDSSTDFHDHSCYAKADPNFEDTFASGHPTCDDAPDNLRQVTMEMQHRRNIETKTWQRPQAATNLLLTEE